MTPPAKPDFQSLGRPWDKWSSLVCWSVITTFVVLLMYWQISSTKREASLVLNSTSPSLGLEITGRLAVAQANLLARETSATAAKSGQTLRYQILANIQQLAISPVDRLAEVVIIRELQGSSPAIEKLDSFRSSIGASAKLKIDDETLKMLYTLGPDAISQPDQMQLTDDLGWFGRLALTQGLPEGDPFRASMLKAARRSLVVAGVVVAGLVAAFALGFLLLIYLIVLFALDKARFAFRPGSAQGPPVFLESFAIWAVAYVALSLGLGHWKNGHSVIGFELLFAIVSMGVSLWPMCRGMSWNDLRKSLGWHAGQGIFTEIGAGILGYVAGLPIMAVGVLFTLVLVKLSHASPTHPITKELTGDLSLSKILALLFTISVAAPFLEETLFRGALYFHLRRRWRPWLSAAIVAFIFAAIHPQGWAAIPVLGSIAIVLAMLREWRGSLLASMTAHGINNGIVLLTVVSVLR